MSHLQETRLETASVLALVVGLVGPACLLVLGGYSTSSNWRWGYSLFFGGYLPPVVISLGLVFVRRWTHAEDRWHMDETQRAQTLTGNKRWFRFLPVVAMAAGFLISKWLFRSQLGLEVFTVSQGVFFGCIVGLGIHVQGRLAERRRRRALGLCSRCGYDLRATADRCPECGTPFKRRPGSTATDIAERLERVQ